MRVALPVEVKFRDLEGMLWLGLNLIENDHEIVLGESHEIKEGFDIIEPDVYLQYGYVQGKKVAKNKILNNSGVSIVTLESEGGAFKSDERFKNKRIHNENFEQVDLHCAWGKHQAKLIEGMMNYRSDDVLVSGHPRFDLLSDRLREIYRKKSDEYIDSYGDYILVNTSLRANRVNKPPDMNPDRIKYESRVLSNYINMVKNLSSKYNIIIRPHPVEDKSTYSENFSNDNISVIREGNVRPWILGAKAVIHRHSTTGIESALLNTPVFSYRPIKNESFDNIFPIKMSIECDSYESLENKIIGLDHNKDHILTENQLKLLKARICNANNPVSASLIADEISNLTKSDEVNINKLEPEIQDRLKRMGVKYFGGRFLEKIDKKISGSERASRHKFPHTSPQELNSKIEEFRKVADINISSVSITEIPYLRNTFIIK